MAFKMRFSWKRTLFFFMILAFPLLVMNVVGRYREKHTPPEERIRRMNAIMEKSGGTLSLKDIMDITNQYAFLPDSYTLRKDVVDIMNKVRSSYVEFWQKELEGRRTKSPKEYYEVSLGKDGKSVLLKGSFGPDELKSLRSNMEWLRALKTMGFERLVVSGPSGRVILVLKEKGSR